MKQYHNILIVKLSSLGDVIHASPCAHALRELFPSARISWIVEKNFAGLLVGSPALDEVIQVDLDYLRKAPFLDGVAYLRALKKDLRARRFDLVLDLQGLFKSALVAWMTGCPERYGYGELREGSWLISQRVSGAHAKDHVIQRYLDVIRFLGSDVAEPTFPLPDFSLEKQGVERLLTGCAPASKRIVFAPGTSKANKEWPVSHYAALAKLLSHEGWTFVIVGGNGDREKGRQLAELIGPAAVDLTGKTNLKELAALLSDAALFVSGDTGPLHIAVAVGVPIVAMYGPTRPERTGPYGKQTAVVRAAKEAGCLMAAITPGEVHQACRMQLDGQAKA